MTAPLLPPPGLAPQAAGRPAARRPEWVRPVTLGGVVAVATVAITVGDPNTTHVPLCPLKALTGLDCPFCGSLRAVHALGRGHIGEAFDHNLVFTAAVPFVLVAWVLWLRRTIRRRPAPASAPTPRWVAVVAAGVLVAFALARNLPQLSWLGSPA